MNNIHAANRELKAKFITLESTNIKYQTQYEEELKKNIDLDAQISDLTVFKSESEIKIDQMDKKIK